MNKISLLTLTIAAVSFGIVQAKGLGRIEDIAMVKEPMTISKEWLNSKKLLAEQPKIGDNVVIAYDMNALAREFANTVKVYLANTNSEKSKELALELLRYFKIAFRVAENNKNDASVVARAQEIEALTNKEGALLIAKARALNNATLVTALTQFGIK